MAFTKVRDIVSGDPVVVFSKTNCSYCTRVKQLLSRLGAKFKVVELDQEVQGALQEMTGKRTVPNVFIGGKHIGGCDDTIAMLENGKLVPLLSESGAITSAA